jgi:hypothetical protein
MAILIPQRPDTVKPGANSWGKLLPAAGTVIGGVIGTAFGPGAGTLAGATAGAGIGATVAGLGQAALGDSMEGKRVGGQSVTPLSQSGAMQRRQQVLQQDPYEQLKQANFALDMAPKEIQQAYRPQLDEAMSLARKQKSYGEQLA